MPTNSLQSFIGPLLQMLQMQQLSGIGSGMGQGQPMGNPQNMNTFNPLMGLFALMQGGYGAGLNLGQGFNTGAIVPPQQGQNQGFNGTSQGFQGIAQGFQGIGPAALLQGYNMLPQGAQQGLMQMLQPRMQDAQNMAGFGGGR